MRVFVYYNLRSKIWSVKALEGDRKNLVVGHYHCLTLQDVTFKVSEAGRQRVIRDKQKNVHAGAVGNLVQCNHSTQGRPVTYNPYKFSTFVDALTHEPVIKADRVVFSDRLVVASPYSGNISATVG